MFLQQWYTHFPHSLSLDIITDLLLLSGRISNSTLVVALYGALQLALPELPHFLDESND